MERSAQSLLTWEPCSLLHCTAWNIFHVTDEGGNVKNYVHAEISKIAKHLINDTIDFKKQYSKKSFLDIVKQIDNLMIKDNKVVLRDFKDIFHSSRELKLDGDNTENQKTLKSTILSKLKSNNVEYNDISLNSDIKSDEKIWKKANKKIKPN